MESGLYMSCYYIQKVKRDRRDEDTGEKKRKFYLMAAFGNEAANIGITARDYGLLEDSGLKVGSALFLPVESFCFSNKIYYRAVGDIAVVEDSGAVTPLSDYVGDGDGDEDEDGGAGAVAKMEAAVKAGTRL